MPTLVLKESTRRALAASGTQTGIGTQSVTYGEWLVDQIAQHGQYVMTTNEQAVKRRIDREAGRFNEAGQTWALENITQQDWIINDMTAMLSELNAVEDKAVECLEYPTFITLNKTQYETDDVPNFMPNPDILDGDGNVVRSKKWSEWKAPNYTHRRNEADTEYYIPTNSDNSGYWVSGVTITRLETIPYVMTEFHKYPDGIEV